MPFRPLQDCLGRVRSSRPPSSATWGGETYRITTETARRVELLRRYPGSRGDDIFGLKADVAVMGGAPLTPIFSTSARLPSRTVASSETVLPGTPARTGHSTLRDHRGLTEAGGHGVQQRVAVGAVDRGAERGLAGERDGCPREDREIGRIRLPITSIFSKTPETPRWRTELPGQPLNEPDPRLSKGTCRLRASARCRGHGTAQNRRWRESARGLRVAKLGAIAHGAVDPHRIQRERVDIERERLLARLLR